MPETASMWRRSPYDRTILGLAVPALGALVAEPLYILTDTAIIGRVGTDELGGLAVASAVLLTLHSVMIFLAYGTTSLVGRFVGGGNLQAAHAQGVAGVWLAGLLGVAAALLLTAWGSDVIGLFGATDDVARHAETYLRVSLLGLPAMLLMLAGAGYLRGLADTLRPLYVAVATAVLNVVVELWFVFGLDWSVAGSAGSTVVAQWAGALAFIVLTVRMARREGVRLLPRLGALRRYRGVGTKLLVRTAALRSAFLASVAVAASIGTAELASHQIALEVLGLTALVLDAVAIAGQAVISQAAGRGDTRLALDASRRMVALSVIVGACLAVVGIATAPLLARVFSTDAQVLSLTVFLFLWVYAGQPVNAVAFALDGVLIGAGDLTFLAWAMCGAAAGFAGLAAVVWATGAGIGWLWAAMTVFAATRAVPLWMRLRSGTWLHASM